MVLRSSENQTGFCGENKVVEKEFLFYEDGIEIGNTQLTLDNRSFYDNLKDSELFEKKLNAKIIIKEDEGHFNNTSKINEIINFIDK